MERSLNHPKKVTTNHQEFIAFFSFLFCPRVFKAFLHQASANFGSIWTFCAEMRERVKGTLNSLAIVLPSPGPDNMTSNPPRCRFGGRKICQARISRLISSNLSPNPYSIQYLFQQFQHPQFQGKKISLWATPPSINARAAMTKGCKSPRVPSNMIKMRPDMAFGSEGTAPGDPRWAVF